MTGSSSLADFPVGAIRADILAWYDTEGRTLPFRGTTDPYLVLVSEAILQQTQISRGAPAWEAFTTRFPTVESLAAASPADVLRAWRGLGYNRRALNLQRVARIVVDELGGVFPGDVAGLERLPGVGPYTARAVASIAFGLPVGAVDTNVRRVLGRAIAGDADVLGAAELQAVADALVPTRRPDAWTHALMDLGSTVCRPRAPRCDACPVRRMCRFAGLAAAAASADRAATRAAEDRSVSRAPAPRPISRPRAMGDGRIPFERSSRWLRGRIVDRLRDAPATAWTELPGPIGTHDARAVATALSALAAEGLVELDPAADPPRARLPVA